VSDAVEMYCQRKFAKKTWKETVHGPELRNLTKYSLYQYPVQEIISVKINGGDPLTGVVLYKDSGIAFRYKGYCLGPEDQLEFIYVAGYDPIPPVIRGVVM